jgi:sortase (surface protein transpeptidase)
MFSAQHILTHCKRQHLRVLAFVLLGIGCVLLVWWGYSERTFSLHNNFKNTLPVATTSAQNHLTALPQEPTILKIPTAQIEAVFEEPLTLNNDGTIGVPTAYDTVAYYKNGPLPGEKGASVVLGHVDSKDGPGAFFYLGQIAVGDEVLIEREDGSVLTFATEGYERVEQSEFPTEKVYGDVPYAGLRLVTCSGTYDKEQQQYSHNLIVYAKLEHYTATKE